jgi:hypothetical protein
MENNEPMTSKVFVLNRHGEPLMPTSPRKARRLLKQGKAKIVQYDPFVTIQLLYGSSGYCQPIHLGTDPGYQTIGFSAITAKEELVGGEFRLLEGMSERLTSKRQYRRQRRQRKRYRKPRFNNRRRNKGWLAPSIQHKYDSHLRLVEDLESVLRITEKTIEVANFDIQKLKDPSISGTAYQQGEQYGFANVREYVFHRDHHTCQNPECPNQAKQPILQVHHIGYWRGDRTDRPSNLITLCTKCHLPRNHQKDGWLHGWQPTLKPFRAETFMTTIRWRLVKAFNCQYTYGYLTKCLRADLDLPKTHYHDAFVIAGGTHQKRAESVFLDQIRRNNRSLQKFYDATYLDQRTGKKVKGQELSSGRRTRNKQLNEENLRPYRGPQVSKGRVSIRKQRYPYQPQDLVAYQGQPYRVKGMQNYGQYIKLAGLTKPVKTELVTPVRWRKGICRTS